MTSDELKNEIITRLRFMNQEERAECISELYGMDIIDRKRARELMGIDELVFQKRLFLTLLRQIFRLTDLFPKHLLNNPRL